MRGVDASLSKPVNQIQQRIQVNKPRFSFEAANGCAAGTGKLGKTRLGRGVAEPDELGGDCAVIFDSFRPSIFTPVVSLIESGEKSG